MTTYVTFVERPNQNFQFSASLDNATYTLIVTWNLFGQRYYLTCYTLQGNVVFNVPLIASPDDYNINLAAGYFNTSIVFRASTQNFEVG
jgi:hypothetical protein